VFPVPACRNGSILDQLPENNRMTNFFYAPQVAVTGTSRGKIRQRAMTELAV
jgi:hypothetical protein